MQTRKTYLFDIVEHYLHNTYMIEDAKLRVMAGKINDKRDDFNLPLLNLPLHVYVTTCQQYL